jgi:hypothetical protein
MPCLETHLTHLSNLKTDDEIARALHEFFAGLGMEGRVCRFPVFEIGGTRNFLIKFHDGADMVKVTSRYKLRSFGFDGVLVEVGR